MASRRWSSNTSWTEDDLEAALTNINEKKMSVLKASRTFKIPRRTLRTYVERNRHEKGKVGRKPVLTNEQENELCERIKRLNEIGYPSTTATLCLSVYRYCKENGISNPFTKKERAGRVWYRNFMKRRKSEILSQMFQSLNPARTKKLNRSIVSDHFEKLYALLLEHDLFDKPYAIYNVDENSCRPTFPAQNEVSAPEDVQNAHNVAPELGENVTIVSCANAIGNAVPPMLLLQGNTLNEDWLLHTPPCTAVEMTAKGSMTITTFIKWLEHFAKFKCVGKVLLIFDGGHFHLDYSIVDAAQKHNIILYCLPRHTTHELQPLGKSVFGVFEHYWNYEVENLWRTRGDRTLPITAFGTVFTPCWDKCMTPSNIKSGFRATGIYPFDSTVTLDIASAPRSETNNDFVNDEGKHEDVGLTAPDAGNRMSSDHFMMIENLHEGGERNGQVVNGGFEYAFGYY